MLQLDVGCEIRLCESWAASAPDRGRSTSCTRRGFREEWTSAATAAQTQWETTKGRTGMCCSRACAYFSISGFQYAYRAIHGRPVVIRRGREPTDQKTIIIANRGTATRFVNAGEPRWCSVTTRRVVEIDLPPSRTSSRENNVGVKNKTCSRPVSNAWCGAQILAYLTVPHTKIIFIVQDWVWWLMSNEQ